MRTLTILLLAVLAALVPSSPSEAADAAVESFDVVVYGGSPAGVMTAVAAAKHSHSVALVERHSHVGGVVSGGLVSSDMGDVKTIGGLAAEFFARIVDYYRDTYGSDSKQLAACHSGAKFEPHVAEMIFDKMLAEQPRIKIFKGHRFRNATLAEGRLESLVVDGMTQGQPRTFTGQVFVDASYEGDLMAAAGVSYRVGREARSEFDEFLAGISAGPRELRGLGDQRTQAYNYRVSITSNTENRILCPKPEHYTPEPFARTDGAAIKAGRVTRFLELYAGREKSAGPNEKFDSNWCDFVGNSIGYADGDWATRERIEARQRNYVLSRLYYLQNDAQLPESFRADARKWGLPKDEFADNGHFPFQLYVREARRMIGRYVLREDDLTQHRSKPDGVCAGSYGIDCHMVQNLLVDGKSVLERTRHVSVDNYDIPYACLTPYEPANLLVPVCLSATHVAYCSLRMEPVYMMLGHAAGDAAHLAIADQTAVQNVDVDQLRDLLRTEKAIVDAGYQPPASIAFSPSHPRPGERVTFLLRASKLEHPIKHAWWDFDGNGQVSVEGQRAEHAFSLEKIYHVSMLVEDEAGLRRIVRIEVPVGIAVAGDLTMDEFDAELYGRWIGAYPELVLGPDKRTPDVFYGPGVNYDVVRNGKKAAARVRFQPTLARAGRYQLCIGFRAARNQATNVPVTIRHAGGVARVSLDQRREITPFPLVPLGEYRFRAGASGFVELTNHDTDGRVAIDAVRWVWLGE